MSVKSSAQVHGLTEALAILKKVEPETVKQINANIRREAKPAIQAVRQYLTNLDPDGNPLNSMANSVLIKDRGDSTRWNFSRVKAGVRFKAGGPSKKKKKASRQNYAMFSIIQSNAAGAIYDVAGSRNSGKSKTFVPNLEGVDVPHKDGDRRGKKGPSRYMWPGAESHIPALTAYVKTQVKIIEKKTNKSLLKRG